MRAYRFCGLCIESTVPLSSLAPCDEEGRDEAALVRFHVETAVDLPPSPAWVVVRTYRGDERPWLSVARLDDGYLLRVHELADFLVDARGTDVACAPAPGCALESIEQLLADQVLPQVLHLRGRPSFHASAVADASGRVVAFLGPSGAGKSTLAGSFASRFLVSDDCLALTLGERVTVEPSYPSVRLFRDSAEALCPSPERLHRASPHTDKLRLELARAPGRLVLERLYLLETSDGPVRIERVSKKAALLGLVEHLHRLDPTDRGRLRDELAFLDEVVSRVVVARLAYPRDYRVLAEVRARVDEDVARG